MIIIYKFYFDKDEELTSAAIGKVVRKFNSEVLPRLKFARGYYDGVGQAIMRRVQEDSSRPNNRIVKNYCATVVDNFQGYLTGKPIAYAASDASQDISTIRRLLDDNDVVNEDSELLRSALIYGVAYELQYVNEANEKRFKSVSPEQVIPIYSNDLEEELLAAVYFYPMTNWEDELAPTAYSVSVYTRDSVLEYRATNDFNTLALLDARPHYYGQVPVVVFNLNSDNAPIFERIISLQDAYNSLLSDEVNDFQSFVDAYMVLKNLDADEGDLAEMKRNRTILIDGDSDVSYLTKDISDTQIENMLDNLNTSIRTISNSPDFSSEEFNSGVSSGVALQFKLVGFNNVASNIEAQMRKALEKRIDLLNAVLALTDTDTCAVDVTFTHNLPNSISDTVTMVNGLRGLVSDETLLAQIPFIDDVAQELGRVREQDSALMDSYSLPLASEA